MRGLDVDLETKLDICTVVDEYAFGWCVFEREAENATAANPGVDRGMLEYVAGLVETGDYPQLAALRDEYGLAEGWQRIRQHRRDPARFRRNLERLLDGIEADLQLSASS